jgi:hypothetical protein
MEKLARACKDLGLKNVDFSGYYPATTSVRANDSGANAQQLATHYLKLAGCVADPRNCGLCALKHRCKAMLMEPWLVKLPD